MGFCISCGRFNTHHATCPNNPNKSVSVSTSNPSPAPTKPALPARPQRASANQHDVNTMSAPDTDDTAAQTPAQFTPVGAGAAHSAHTSSSWTSALCDCGSDVGGCCSAYWCFCCFVRENSRLLDGEPHTCCANCCYPGTSAKNRAQALATYGIRERACDTCLILWCCPCCSEMQVRREMQQRRGQPSRITPMADRRNIPAALTMADDL